MRVKRFSYDAYNEMRDYLKPFKLNEVVMFPIKQGSINYIYVMHNEVEE